MLINCTVKIVDISGIRSLVKKKVNSDDSQFDVSA